MRRFKQEPIVSEHLPDFSCPLAHRVMSQRLTLTKFAGGYFLCLREGGIGLAAYSSTNEAYGPDVAFESERFSVHVILSLSHTSVKKECIMASIGLNLTNACIFAATLFLTSIGQAAVTTYTDRAAWQAAAGSSATIDFATTDPGNPVSNPANDVPYSSLTLKGVTFLNVNSYYNQLIYNAAGTIRVNLPANTTAVAMDLMSFFNDPGAYTATLSTGETFTMPNNPALPFVFFGLTSTSPLQWIEISLNAGYIAIDNFSFVAPNPVLDVGIDVLPGVTKNPIIPALNAYLPVAILSTAACDPADVDIATVRFGITGAEAGTHGSLLWDVNRDGKRDLILFFRSKDAAIACGTTSVALTGQTKTGQKIQGEDAIVTVGCRHDPAQSTNSSIFKLPF